MRNILIISLIIFYLPNLFASDFYQWINQNKCKGPIWSYMDLVSELKLNKGEEGLQKK